MDFVCISLKHRKDRRDQMKQLFSKLGISVHWWIVEKHPTSGVLGCTESHLNVWKKFGDKEYLCVFEDDIDGIPENFQYVLQNISSVDAMIINMAPTYLYVSGFDSKGFIRGQFIDAAAYILPRKHIPTIISYVERSFGIIVDVALLGLPMVAYPTFWQVGSPSDISQPDPRKRSSQDIHLLFPPIGFACSLLLEMKRGLYPKIDPKFIEDRRVFSEET
jgi:GR25 family glycosyltransferase involved in LPS biosynthesis